jgi:membrane protein implicated in regulation of membrane protease activity
MKHLVRPSGRVLPVGTASTCYRSDFNAVEAGDEVEVVNSHGETLNIAKVVEVRNDQITYIMVA